MVYQSVRVNRVAPFSYNFDAIPQGDYEVTLYFNEPRSTTGVGDRIFDVLAEGVVSLDDFDIVAAAGAPRTAHNETFIATVSDGQLNLDFVPVNSNFASVAAVSVVALSPAAEASVAAASFGADEAPAAIIDRSISDSNVYGVASGSHTNTHAGDNIYQTLTEESDAGNNRSRLEHQWQFNVTGGSSVTFVLEAHHSSATEGFTFDYSTDGVIWTTMLTVTKSSDDDSTQSFALPDSISGTVFVRVRDTIRSRGESPMDSLFIDDMYFLSE